jgi:hypothetical protein
MPSNFNCSFCTTFRDCMNSFRDAPRSLIKWNATLTLLLPAELLCCKFIFIVFMELCLTRIEIGGELCSSSREAGSDSYVQLYRRTHCTCWISRSLSHQRGFSSGKPSNLLSTPHALECKELITKLIFFVSYTRNKKTYLHAYRIQ